MFIDAIFINMSITDENISTKLRPHAVHLIAKLLILSGGVEIDKPHRKTINFIGRRVEIECAHFRTRISNPDSSKLSQWFKAVPNFYIFLELRAHWAVPWVSELSEMLVITAVKASVFGFIRVR